MKRPHTIWQCGRMAAMTAVFWFVTAPWASAGSRDAALLKPFTEIFPSASQAEVVRLDRRLPRSTQMVEIHSSGELLGYGLTLKVKSRSGKFRMTVALSPECEVLDVQVPDYPHTRGRAVRKPTFLEQFRGCAYGDPLHLGEHIDGVSGATSSANAVTGGVRQALIIAHRHVNGR